MIIIASKPKDGVPESPKKNDAETPGRRKRRLLGIRVAYDGSYLCTNEDGVITAENIVLRKNLFLRYGRWFLSLAQLLILHAADSKNVGNGLKTIQVVAPEGGQTCV